MKPFLLTFPQSTTVPIGDLFSFEILSQSEPLSTGNCQGVCFDGTHYYFTADNSIYKYTRSGDTYSLVTSRSCAGDAPTGKRQIDSMEYKEGYLWIAANSFGTGYEPKYGWVLKYDPSDLTLVEYFQTIDHWAEGASWKDVGNGNELWIVYTDTDFCSRYKNISGVWTHIDDYLMSYIEGQTNIIGERGLYQGCTWYGDYFIAVTHAINPDTEIHIYKWNGTGFDAVQKQDSVIPTAGQGISWESYGNVMLFADRDKPNNIQRIIRVNVTTP